MSFLTISKSLCSELLMKKRIERGVYTDEYGLVSDQSEAYDLGMGARQGMNKVTVKCGMKVAAPVGRIPVENLGVMEQPGRAGLTAEVLLHPSQGWGLCRVCARDTGGTDQEIQKGYSDGFGRILDTSSI